MSDRFDPEWSDEGRDSEPGECLGALFVLASIVIAFYAVIWLVWNTLTALF